uniref:hemagglutinin repeat-containing protein n=1 Tax=Iodobacter sp. CM08 TaxID=3085902 RepID=UPI0039905914
MLLCFILSSDVVWQNSQLNAGKTLTLISGGDTNLRGATVTGQQVIADIKGNLNIGSLQDISQFDNKQIGGQCQCHHWLWQCEWECQRFL